MKTTADIRQHTAKQSPTAAVVLEKLSEARLLEFVPKEEGVCAKA